MFTLSTKDKFDDLERLIDRFVNMGNAEGRKITDGIRQQFAANFTRQGSGAGRWAALRPSTIRQRIEAGFSGSHPILVRTGKYRSSFVGRGGDNYENIQRTFIGTIYEVGSNDPRVPFLELGRANMPARSVTLFDEAQEGALVRLIDYALLEIEKREWR